MVWDYNAICFAMIWECFAMVYDVKVILELTVAMVRA